MSIFKPMIEKCLGSPRKTIVAKSIECVLLLFEGSEEFGEEVQDALIKYTQDKRPKVSFHGCFKCATLRQRVIMFSPLCRFSKRR